MKITISRDKVNAINLDWAHKFLNHNATHSRYFFGLAGQEHYRLLAYLSRQFEEPVVYDIGTNQGHSALAFAHNARATIHSWDINNWLQLNDAKATGIKFNIGDVLKSDLSGLCSSDIILLDTEHDGEYENELTGDLEDSGFAGILIMDDIHLNDEMEHLWQFLCQTYTCYDATEYGHDTGTGIVDYTGELDFVMEGV